MRTDPDQEAVYFAESTVFEGTAFEEIVYDNDMQHLADELFGSDWWQSQNIPVPEIHVRRLEATRSVAKIWEPWTGIPPQIRFMASQVCPWYLAHEASHVAADHLYRRMCDVDMSSHGKHFRETYISIASLLLGADTAYELGRAFNREGLPTLTHINVPVFGSGNGIFPEWRSFKAIAEMRRLNKSTETERINGAIPL